MNNHCLPTYVARPAITDTAVTDDPFEHQTPNDQPLSDPRPPRLYQFSYGEMELDLPDDQPQEDNAGNDTQRGTKRDRDDMSSMEEHDEPELKRRRTLETLQAPTEPDQLHEETRSPNQIIHPSLPGQSEFADAASDSDDANACTDERSQLTHIRNFDNDELTSIFENDKPDPERLLDLVFGENNSRRPDGKYTAHQTGVRPPGTEDEFNSLLASVGAYYFFQDLLSPSIVILPVNFDESKFIDGLLSIQANERSHEENNDHQVNNSDSDDSERTKKNTALMFACELGIASAVDALLAAGANVNARNSFGKTALIYAARNNRLDVLKKILACEGVDKDFFDSHDYSAISYAVEAENVEAVEMLLEAGVSINFNTMGNPLELAISQKNHILCKLLAKFGADPDLRERRENTKLMEYACKGDMDRCKLLCEIGADVCAVSYDGSVLAHAAESGNIEIFNYLYEQGASLNIPEEDDPEECENLAINSPLISAVARDNPDMVRHLLSLGCRINQRGRQGQTALMEAVAKQSYLCVQLLLDLGADTNLLDENDVSVLEYAAAHAQSEWISKLILQGASLILFNYAGFRALAVSIIYGNFEAALVLLQSGILLNPPLSQNQREFPSLLHLLLMHGEPTPVSMRVLQLLLDQSAALDQDVEELNDALMLAAYSFNSPAVATLLDRGAVNRRPESENIAALEIAIENLDRLISKKQIYGGDASEFGKFYHRVLRRQLSRNELRLQKSFMFYIQPFQEAYHYPVCSQDDDLAFTQALLTISLLISASSSGGHLLEQTSKDLTRVSLPATRDLLMALHPNRAQILNDVQIPGSLTSFSWEEWVSDFAKFIDAEIDQYRLVDIEAYLSAKGLPAVAAEFLAQYIKALPLMRTALFSTEKLPSNPLLIAVCIAGMFASLERTLVNGGPDMSLYDVLPHVVHLPNGALSTFRLRDLLTHKARGETRLLVSIGTDFEQSTLAPRFENLFEQCVKDTWPVLTPKSFEQTYQPSLEKITASLRSLGVYAVLADHIGTSWQAAWREAGERFLAEQKLHEVYAPGNEWMGFFADDKDGPGDEQMLDFLEQAFRRQLAERVDGLNAGIFKLQSEPTPCDGVYADLVHRQLYMLMQYMYPDKSVESAGGPAAIAVAEQSSA